MIVVADSSPLIALLNVEAIEILPRLFSRVMVPVQVLGELRAPRRSEAVRTFFQSGPPWIEECEPDRLLVIPGLHPGEVAAISLALQVKADILLIDEADGRRVARERRIPVVGTIGVLELAATRGWIDLEATYDLLRQTDFWVSEELLQASLRRFLDRDDRGPRPV
jgi:predicted nucleic acid-binding protein